MKERKARDEREILVTLCWVRPFSIAMLMKTSTQAVHFMVYEAAMSWLNPEKTYNPSHHAFAGAVAGGAAAVAALPLDACKTLLNTQEVMLDQL